MYRGMYISLVIISGDGENMDGVDVGMDDALDYGRAVGDDVDTDDGRAVGMTVGGTVRCFLQQVSLFTLRYSY